MLCTYQWSDGTRIMQMLHASQKKKQQNSLTVTKVHIILHLQNTNLLLARCHSKQYVDQLANSQTQHKNDESQHKLGETNDLQN